MFLCRQDFRRPVQNFKKEALSSKKKKTSGDCFRLLVAWPPARLHCSSAPALKGRSVLTSSSSSPLQPRILAPSLVASTAAVAASLNRRSRRLRQPPPLAAGRPDPLRLPGFIAAPYKSGSPRCLISHSLPSFCSPLLVPRRGSGPVRVAASSPAADGARSRALESLWDGEPRAGGRVWGIPEGIWDAN